MSSDSSVVKHASPGNRWQRCLLVLVTLSNTELSVREGHYSL